MGITANTNISSIAASRALNESRTDLTQAMERLSSGKRINSSRDDAAGQTVVSRMRAQITSLNQAIRNANDGLSMVQTYEGAADEIEDMLIRMRELATLVQNGTYTTADGANADLEYKQLKAEIDRVQSKTKFNGTLDIASNTGNQTYSFQVGFNGGDAVPWPMP
jgi:flagellin